MKLNKTLVGISVAFLLMPLFGCAGNLSSFEFFSYKSKSLTGLTLSRTEMDNGGGTIAAPGGHRVQKFTLGGSYLRTPGLNAGPATHVMNPGLYGNPRATH